MIKNIFKNYKASHLVIITSIVLAVSGLHAEESPASEALSDVTKEYLSDPSRTGSLVGSILVGAAIANPLAPLLGSVAGFFVGKTSDYSDKPSNSQQSSYASRSIIPQDVIQVTNMTGLTGKSPQEIEATAVSALTQETTTLNQSEETQQPIIVEVTQETEAVNQPEETQQPIIVEVTRETGAQGSKLQLQLASVCSHVELSQPMPVQCYYYSQ